MDGRSSNGFELGFQALFPGLLFKFPPQPLGIPTFFRWAAGLKGFYLVCGSVSCGCSGHWLWVAGLKDFYIVGLGL